MTDWNSDPELKALRDEFIASFAGRRAGLAKWLQVLSARGSANVSPEEQAPCEIHVIAHNLAGSAGTYGYTALGEIAGALDDFLSLEKKPVPAAKLLRFSKLLDQALSGQVVPAEAFHELTSCVESLASGARS